jgi:IS4 transposase
LVCFRRKYEIYSRQRQTFHLSFEVKPENRALHKADKLQGRWHKLDTLEVKTNQSYLIYLEGMEAPVQLIKQIFTNEDGKTAVQYLICSDTKLSIEDITESYQKRWRAEEYHKSLKRNASLERFPDTNGNEPNESFFRRAVRLYQIKEIENQDQTKSLCIEIETVSQSIIVSFSNSPRINQAHLSA